MSAIEQALNLVAETPLLPEQQIKAENIWRNKSWPNRKTEAWRYTPLKALADGSYFQKPKNSILEATTAQFEMLDLEAARLVFIDGRYAEALSNYKGSAVGLSITPFDQLDDAQIKRVEENLDQASSKHNPFFNALNTATLEQGVLVEVAAKAQLDHPIHIVHIARTQEKATANARLLWLQDNNSQATLIEHFVGEPDAALFTHSITELFVGENAFCDHYRLQLDETDCLHIGGVYSQLHRNARLNSFYLSLGSKLQRVDVVTEFEGEGAEAINNGVYLPRNNDLVDFHTCVEHKVAHCQSNEIFRGIIGDSARAVFNGRIHIHRDAQKTLAELSNKNLLTSDKAEVNTKPELEIYADDVQCAHGATVAEIDKLALHYLRTRGIGESEARVMLSFGFINELIEHLNNQVVANYLKPLIAERFAKPSYLEIDV